jgi:hypothetical protein
MSMLRRAIETTERSREIICRTLALFSDSELEASPRVRF